MKYKDKPQAKNRGKNDFFSSDRYQKLIWAATNEDNMYSAAEIENAQIELADCYLAAWDIGSACEYYRMAAEEYNSVFAACKLASLYENGIVRSDKLYYAKNFFDPIKGYYCMAAIAYENIIDTMSPGENQQYIKELPSGAEKYMNAVLFKHFPELGIPDADAEYDISKYLAWRRQFDRSDEWRKRAAEHNRNDANEELKTFRRI